MRVAQLSVIIVSWNVKDFLERCLASLEKNIPSTIPYEVIVIDNASNDGTVSMLRSKFSSVKLIANNANRGFGAACNQGVQEAAQAEYLAFLNPDTEIHEKTFESLIAFLENHPDVAIAGPRILGTDGKTQSSVRGFPTPLVCLFIFLKIDRFLKFFPAVHQYYRLDFDYSQTQQVDQLMGACLIMRKKHFEDAGGFDERFFLWFEEVDLCKRVSDAGLKIFYVADSTLTHHKARSFTQESILIRQKNFYQSSALYLKKHFSKSPFSNAVALFFFAYTQVLSYAIVLSKQVPRVSEKTLFRLGVFAISFVAIGSTELLSLAVYSDILSASSVFIVIVAFTLALSLWHLPIGIAILFSELVIGSKGYLFSLDSWDSRVSIRMGIFAAVMFAWALRAIIARKAFHIFQSRFFWWYVSLALVVTYGVIHALILHVPVSLVFQDANAWIFFLIAIVVYDALSSKERVAQLLSCLAAALVAQTISILLTFYIMGHRGFGEIILGGWYYWIRHSGVGEITALLGSTTRVFFQSQIFALVGLFILFGFITAYFFIKLESEKEILGRLIRSSLHEYRYVLLLLCVLLSSVIISFSRSFWVALCGSIIVCVLMMRAYGISLRVLCIALCSLAACALGAIGLLIAISSIPFPSTSGIFDIQSLEERVQDLEEEEAAKSRWKLLPVLVDTIRARPIAGHGFGKTVSYESADPRFRERMASGLYTTYAFEWGYLDIWIKLGLLGLLVYLGYCLNLLSRGFQLGLSYLKKGCISEGGLLLGVAFGILALLITHIFTPYLNHPLGISVLILSSVIIDLYSTRNAL